MLEGQTKTVRRRYSVEAYAIKCRKITLLSNMDTDHSFPGVHMYDRKSPFLVSIMWMLMAVESVLGKGDCCKAS